MKDRFCANCGKQLNYEMADENGFNFCSNKCYYTFYFDKYHNGNFPLYASLKRGDFTFKRDKEIDWDCDDHDSVVKITEHWTNCPNEPGVPSLKGEMIDESATIKYRRKQKELEYEASRPIPQPQIVQQVVQQVVKEAPKIVITDTSRNQDFYVGCGDGNPYSVHVDADHGLITIGYSRY